MKRSALILLAAIPLSLVAWQLVPGQPPDKSKDTRLQQFMLRKLELSKGILEGIAMDDSDKIVKNSQGLSLLSMESTWNVMTTERYLQLGADFRRAADSITEAGRNKNTDRATLGYFDLTMRCVECHKYLREK